MMETGIQRHGFGFTPQRLRRRVVAKMQWPTTYQSSCLQQCKTGSRDFQRIQSTLGEISAPNSSTTSWGLSQNLELNGICTRSIKRKVNPSENSCGGS